MRPIAEPTTTSLAANLRARADRIENLVSRLQQRARDIEDQLRRGGVPMIGFAYEMAVLEQEELQSRIARGRERARDLRERADRLAPAPPPPPAPSAPLGPPTPWFHVRLRTSP
jgi:hypothetical protein